MVLDGIFSHDLCDHLNDFLFMPCAVGLLYDLGSQSFDLILATAQVEPFVKALIDKMEPLSQLMGFHHHFFPQSSNQGS